MSQTFFSREIGSAMPLSRLLAVAVAITAVLATCVHGVTISPTVVVSSLQVAPATGPQDATLHVSIENEGQPAISIAAFQFELSIAGPDDAVKFIGTGAPQSHPYLFAVASAGPLASVGANGLTISFGDFLDSGFAEASHGVGLASIMLRIEPQAAGKTYEVRFNTDQAASFLAVGTSAFVPFNARNATIAVVPEPSTAIALILAVAALACYRRQAFGVE